MPETDVSREKTGPIALTAPAAGQAHPWGLLRIAGPAKVSALERLRDNSTDYAILNKDDDIIAECFGRVAENKHVPSYANASRFVACWNACRGLTAEQVAQINHTMKLLKIVPGETPVPDFLATIPAKLAAFDAMREALEEISNTVSEEKDGAVPAWTIARAALTQADEASK